MAANNDRSIYESYHQYGELDLKHPVRCLHKILQQNQKPLCRVNDSGNITIDLKAIQDAVPLDLNNGKKEMFGNNISNVMTFGDSDYLSILPESQFDRRKPRDTLIDIDRMISEQIKNALEEGKDKLTLISADAFAENFLSTNKNWRNQKINITETSWLDTASKAKRKFSRYKPFLRFHADEMTYDIDMDNIRYSLLRYVKDRVIEEMAEEEFFHDEDEAESEFHDEYAVDALQKMKEPETVEYEYLNFVTNNIIPKLKKTYSVHFLKKLADALSTSHEREQDSQLTTRDIENFRCYAYVVDMLNEFFQGTIQLGGMHAGHLYYNFKINDYLNEEIEINIREIFSRTNALQPLPFAVDFFTSLADEAITHESGDSRKVKFNYKLKANGYVPDSESDSIYQYRLQEIKDNASYLNRPDQVKANIYEARVRGWNAFRNTFLYMCIFAVLKRSENLGKPRDYDLVKEMLSQYIREFDNFIRSKLYENVSLSTFLNGLHDNLLANKTYNIESRFLDSVQRAILSISGWNYTTLFERLGEIVLTLALTDDCIQQDDLKLRDQKSIISPYKKYKAEYLKSLVVTSMSAENLTNSFYWQRLVIRTRQEYTGGVDSVSSKTIEKDGNGCVLPFEFLPAEVDCNGKTSYEKLFYTFSEMKEKGRKEGTIVRILADRYTLNHLDIPRDKVNPGNPLMGLEKVGAVSRIVFALLADRYIRSIICWFRENESELLRPDYVFGMNHYTSDKFNLAKRNPRNDPNYKSRIGGYDVRIEPPSCDTFMHDAFKNIAFLNSESIPFKTQGLVQEHASPFHPDDKREIVKSPPKSLQFRRKNAAVSFLSMLPARMPIPAPAGIDRIAIISVSSRPSDRIRNNVDQKGPKSVVYGEVQRFWATEEGNASYLNTFWPTSFSSVIDGNHQYLQADVIQEEVSRLVSEGYKDIVIVGKIPFTRKFGVATVEDATFTNPDFIKKLLDRHSDENIRIYPFMTEQSWGKRLHKSEIASPQPIFVTAEDSEGYGSSSRAGGESASINGISVERFCSVLTGRIVGNGKNPKSRRNYSGSCDYFIINHLRKENVNAGAIDILTSPAQRKKRQIIYEAIKLLHASRYEKDEKGESTSMKLYPLESVIGNNNIGKQMEIPVTNNYPGDCRINYHAILKKVDEVIAQTTRESNPEP